MSRILVAYFSAGGVTEKAAKESDERIVKTTGKLLNVREEV